MFQDVPECSIFRVLSTPKFQHFLLGLRDLFSNYTCPKSHEKNYKWNKIILFESLCYMAKKGNIKASNIFLNYRPSHL